ncbi:MAG: response regulator [Acidobacteriota bacterium]|nr:response regulator [Acidobacteriota bacterium]
MTVIQDVRTGTDRPALSPEKVLAALDRAMSLLDDSGLKTPQEPDSSKAYGALLVERSPVHRMVTERILSKAGYLVQAVASSREALEDFARSSYAVVLLDCDDPDADAYATAVELRGMERGTRRTPIIALTASASQQDRKRRKAAGIDNYIAKPVRREAVEAVLSRYAPNASNDRPLPSMSLDQRVLHEFMELFDGDATRIRELIDLFLATASASLGLLRQGVEDENAEALIHGAHSLRTASAQFGAHRMQNICTTIEVLARTGSISGTEVLLQELSLAYERVSREIQPAQWVAPKRDSIPTARYFGSNVPGDLLVAESDMLTARFLKGSLGAAGFRVVHVTDGEAALAAFRQERFQTIILDSDIPKLDGFGVLTALRLQKNAPNTPVVMISSRKREHDVLQAFDLGADDYVTKPFNPLEVVCRVRRLARCERD